MWKIVKMTKISEEEAEKYKKEEIAYTDKSKTDSNEEDEMWLF